jgi:prepilin-type processing-associated H-X9-DG protein
LNGDPVARGSRSGTKTLDLGFEERDISVAEAPNNFGLNSKHTGGVQIAFADGSVHFVADSIDFGVYRAMATLAGGEIAQLPWGSLSCLSRETYLGSD